MILEETTLSGSFLITLNQKNDNRGFFARCFCKDVLETHGLQGEFVQCNISQNHKVGTLRGLHYQKPPHEEVKIVFCRRGAIYDVIVDIRPSSPTYGQWVGVELSEQNCKGLYIPKGFAHGFQTLTDDTEVFYFMGSYYNPSAGTGIRWDDPILAITWPHSDIIISDADKLLPRLNS